MIYNIPLGNGCKSRLQGDVQVDSTQREAGGRKIYGIWPSKLANCNQTQTQAMARHQVQRQVYLSLYNTAELSLLTLLYNPLCDLDYYALLQGGVVSSI